jgi:hypothetical protein
MILEERGPVENSLAQHSRKRKDDIEVSSKETMSDQTGEAKVDNMTELVESDLHDSEETRQSTHIDRTN